MAHHDGPDPLRVLERQHEARSAVARAAESRLHADALQALDEGLVHAALLCHPYRWRGDAVDTGAATFGGAGITATLPKLSKRVESALVSTDVFDDA